MYKTLFMLTDEHRFSWAELEAMIPFEVDLICSMIKEKNDKIREIENQTRLAAEAASRRRF